MQIGRAACKADPRAMTFGWKSSPSMPTAGPIIGPAVPQEPEELRMRFDSIDAEIAASNARSLQTTQAGALD